MAETGRQNALNKFFPKNFFGQKNRRSARIFPSLCEKAAGPIGQNPLKIRQIRQSKLSSLAARYVGIKTVSFRRRGERRKKFSEKIFSGRKIWRSARILRVFAYRRGRRTGVVLPEKGQKSPKTGAPPPRENEARCVSIRIGPFGGGKINFGAKVRKRSPPPIRVFLRSVSLVSE